MLPLKITIINYLQTKGYCTASLASGEIVMFEPFVSNAVELSDDEYEAGAGYEMEGVSFLLTDFIVSPCEHESYNYMIIANRGGMIPVQGK
jgi:hypothetical protein